MWFNFVGICRGIEDIIHGSIEVESALVPSTELEPRTKYYHLRHGNDQPWQSYLGWGMLVRYLFMSSLSFDLFVIYDL